MATAPAAPAGTARVAALLVLPLTLPMVEIPEPTGPFPVGTVAFELLDQGREEPFAGLQNRSRRIMVQVWYPAIVDEDDAVQRPWIEDLEVVGPALAREFGFPGFFLGYTRFAPAHAHPGADPVGGTVPVVVYSHGWRGFRSIALDQMESLASHGFMVIAIDHTHGSVATVFPDGTVAYLDPDALPDEGIVGEEAYERAANRLVETFSEDQISVLNALEAGPSGPFGSLADLADLDLVGVYGHSTGGGAAVRTCIVDERCVAVAGLDAWVEPISRRELAREVPVPSMYLRSDGWRGTPNDGLLRGLAERSPASSYWLGIEGASHNDFVLPPSFSPVATRLGVKGRSPRTGCGPSSTTTWWPSSAGTCSGSAAASSTVRPRPRSSWSSFHLSVVSCQLSAFSFQFSAVSFQLSVLSFQFSAVSFS
jgi:hypothetical protein